MASFIMKQNILTSLPFFLASYHLNALKCKATFKRQSFCERTKTLKCVGNIRREFSDFNMFLQNMLDIPREHHCQL